MGFPSYGEMNITLSLDDELVKKVRKIAVERDTTLTGLVRDYLEKLAVEDATSGRRWREREALERSFERFRFKVGKRTWKRADLYGVHVGFEGWNHAAARPWRRSQKSS